jgi:hypothetical protein
MLKERRGRTSIEIGNEALSGHASVQGPICLSHPKFAGLTIPNPSIFGPVNCAVYVDSGLLEHRNNVNFLDLNHRQCSDLKSISEWHRQQIASEWSYYLCLRLVLEADSNLCCHRS